MKGVIEPTINRSLQVSLPMDHNLQRYPPPHQKGLLQKILWIECNQPFQISFFALISAGMILYVVYRTDEYRCRRLKKGFFKGCVWSLRNGCVLESLFIYFLFFIYIIFVFVCIYFLLLLNSAHKWFEFQEINYLQYFIAFYFHLKYTEPLNKITKLHIS